MMEPTTTAAAAVATTSTRAGRVSNARIQCEFEEEGRKVVVSLKHLRDLENRAAATFPEAPEADQEANSPSCTSPATPFSGPHSEGRGRGARCPPAPLSPPAPPPATASLVHNHHLSPQSTLAPDDVSETACNPLASAASSYIADDSGRLRSLGESSTWSFSQRTLMLIRDVLDPSVAPEIPANEESRAYGLSWGSSDFDNQASFTDLPSIDYAIYLLNGVKFHVGQLYHLFDEAEFMRLFHEFYDRRIETAKSHRVWYIQFLVLLALGKALVVTPVNGSTALPGSDLFIRAMSLLPDPSSMFSDALTAVETLCAIALFLQGADMRNSAYIYIGQALRTAMTFALHRERPAHNWNPQVSARCHRAWWTVYILDRTFSSSMGVPISIQDNDITTPMPARQGSHKSSALFIHVRLSGLMSEVVNKVYGPEGRLSSSFLASVRKTLGSIASIATELSDCFPLTYDRSGASVSRVAAHLHLFYHQCILLTMYPLLLYLFTMKLKEEPQNVRRPRAFSETTQAMLQSCAESSYMMIRILTLLREQSLLESAIPFDLERTFASTFVSTILSFIYPVVKNHEVIQSEACRVLDELIGRGSIPAQFRKDELNQLERMICLWKNSSAGTRRLRVPSSTEPPAGESRANPSEDPARLKETVPGCPGPDADWDESNRDTCGLISTQIASLAQMVDMQQGSSGGDEDWMDDWLWESNPGEHGFHIY